MSANDPQETSAGSKSRSAAISSPRSVCAIVTAAGPGQRLASIQDI